MSAIGATQSGTDAETSLGKIQSVAHSASHSVEGNPAHVFLADAALEHQVLDEASDGVVGEGSYDCCVQSKAASKTSSHVVLASTFPRTEVAGSGNALIARIKPQHDFTEAYQVPGAAGFRLDVQFRHSYEHTLT